MLPAIRRQAIIKKLQSNGSTSNQDLAHELGVSLDTIRRDMRILAANGLVSRTHGGAVWTDEHEVSLRLNGDPQMMAKRAIAHKALNFIRPGETIALDIGTTNMQLARALLTGARSKPAAVITSDLSIATILARAKGININVVGGAINERNFLWGPLTKRILEILYFNTLFLATSGITLEEGLTDPYPEAAEVKQLFIRNAKRTILLTDHTKFGVRHMVHVAPLESINTIITDKNAPVEFLAKLEERGITCIRAN